MRPERCGHRRHSAAARRHRAFDLSFDRGKRDADAAAFLADHSHRSRHARRTHDDARGGGEIADTATARLIAPPPGKSGARSRLADGHETAARGRARRKARALAQLRAPPSKLKLGLEPGVSNVDAGEGGGDRAAYSIRDYVRAIVEQHWSRNTADIAGRNLSIPLRIVMKRDGAIVSAEIADAARAKAEYVLSQHRDQRAQCGAVVLAHSAAARRLRAAHDLHHRARPARRAALISAR